MERTRTIRRNGLIYRFGRWRPNRPDNPSGEAVNQQIYSRLVDAVGDHARSFRSFPLKINTWVHLRLPAARLMEGSPYDRAIRDDLLTIAFSLPRGRQLGSFVSTNWLAPEDF